MNDTFIEKIIITIVDSNGERRSFSDTGKERILDWLKICKDKTKDIPSISYFEEQIDKMENEMRSVNVSKFLDENK